MIVFYCGTDRDKLRDALRSDIDSLGDGAVVVRITDVHTATDMREAFMGRGLFNEKKVIVFDGILGGSSMELRDLFMSNVSLMKQNKETYFVIESMLDIASRKLLEKHADKTVRLDLPKKPKDTTVFALANALQRGDKKSLWIGLEEKLRSGEASEALHGVLFWGSKQAIQQGNANNYCRELAELPHVARRHGEDMDLALLRFALSIK